jgi:hypothetical protein
VSVFDPDAIRARLDAATPGPWRLDGRSIVAETPISDDGPADGKWNHSVVCSVGAWRSGRPTDADAEFIAHSRTDVQLLLAENERLGAEVDRLDSELTRAENQVHHLTP